VSHRGFDCDDRVMFVTGVAVRRGYARRLSDCSAKITMISSCLRALPRLFVGGGAHRSLGSRIDCVQSE